MESDKRLEIFGVDKVSGGEAFTTRRMRKKRYTFQLISVVDVIWEKCISWGLS